jgi:hypothetical protein
LIFYFGIILQVKKKDKLFNNFFESFKFDWILFLINKI